MVHCLQGLASKSTAVTETYHVQLSGCVLVAVLHHLSLLESGEIQNIVHDLMKALKLPCTDREFVEDWWRNLSMYYAAKRCGYLI